MPDTTDITALADRLMGLAERATPGPWKYGSYKGHCIDWVVTQHPDWQTANAAYICETGNASGQDGLPVRWPHNAAYIAACDPATVTALCAAVKALHAERDALRADAERYRWLRDKCPGGEIAFDHTGGRDGGHRITLVVPFDGRRIDGHAEFSCRLDKSIDDAARTQTGGANG